MERQQSSRREPPPPPDGAAEYIASGIGVASRAVRCAQAPAGSPCRCFPGKLAPGNTPSREDQRIMASRGGGGWLWDTGSIQGEFHVQGSRWGNQE